MSEMSVMLSGSKEFVIRRDTPVLVTGATGFIGSRVVRTLLEMGFSSVRCFARPFSSASRLEAQVDKSSSELFRGNLQSAEDCYAATRDVGLILHLAAGAGEKSFPDAYINSVITTRNLLEASLRHKSLKRFVNVSSFAVYTNSDKPHGKVLDERAPVEVHPERRNDPYCFAKVKQDEIVREYGERFGIPFVIVRPGYVYGPGKTAITGRVGIDTFGIFLHLGGSNPIPFTYVDNCAEAIVLAGLRPGIDGEVFNIVDDELYSSRQFLKMYKRNVKRFRSLCVPNALSYALSYAWERYSEKSQGQLPPAFNRGRWHSVWKKTRYSNQKLKTMTGWLPKISTSEGLQRYFESCREGLRDA